MSSSNMKRGVANTIFAFIIFIILILAGLGAWFSTEFDPEGTEFWSAFALRTTYTQTLMLASIWWRLNAVRSDPNSNVAKDEDI